MGATLSLPQRTPNSYTTIGFCTLYVIADTVSDYMINNSCKKGIKSLHYPPQGLQEHSLEGYE